MKFLLNKKIGYLFIFLIIFSWLYPTYFISDDWEHLDSIYKNGSNTYIKFWIYRIPALYYSHTTLFPLFQNEYFFLANLICWSFLFLGMLYVLETFGILKKLKQEPTWFFISFFIMLCFNHNNFEFLFWPSFMVNFPGFFLVSLGFYLTNKFPLWKIQFVRAIFWTIGFYSTESLFFMGILLEIAYPLWVRTSDSYIEKIKYLIRQLILPFVFVLISKVILTYLKPYGYAATWGFKPHLFSQTMSLIFLHDYYKVRWLTGIIAFVSYLLLFEQRFKEVGKLSFLKKEVLFGAIVLASTSYYFFIMNYSARRALGGQLFITWGSFCLIYFNIWRKENSSIIRKVVLILFPACWLVHSIYVINLKIGDRAAFRANAEEIRIKLETETKPLFVHRNDIMKNVNTGWNLVNEKQMSGWMRHFFTESELKNFKYK